MGKETAKILLKGLSTKCLLTFHIPWTSPGLSFFLSYFKRWPGWNCFHYKYIISQFNVIA